MPLTAGVTVSKTTPPLPARRTKAKRPNPSPTTLPPQNRRAEWSLPCSARFTSLLKHYAKRSIFAANRPYYRGSSPTVNSEPQPRNRKPLLWGVSGVVIGAFVATNPFYAPDVSLDLCIAAWGADMLLVLILSARRLGARIGALIAGLFLAVPCFVPSSPLWRGLLMCIMCMPLAAALALVLVAPIAGFRPRLAYLCSVLLRQACGPRKIRRRRGDGASSGRTVPPRLAARCSRRGLRCDQLVLAASRVLR